MLQSIGLQRVGHDSVTEQLRKPPRYRKEKYETQSLPLMNSAPHVKNAYIYIYMYILDGNKFYQGVSWRFQISNRGNISFV